MSLQTLMSFTLRNLNVPEFFERLDSKKKFKCQLKLEYLENAVCNACFPIWKLGVERCSG